MTEQIERSEQLALQIMPIFVHIDTVLHRIKITITIYWLNIPVINVYIATERYPIMFPSVLVYDIRRPAVMLHGIDLACPVASLGIRQAEYCLRKFPRPA